MSSIIIKIVKIKIGAKFFVLIKMISDDLKNGYGYILIRKNSKRFCKRCVDGGTIPTITKVGF